MVVKATVVLAKRETIKLKVLNLKVPKGRGKYLSLVVNKLLSGKRTVVLKTNIDKKLNNQVDYYNQQIKLMSSTNLQDFHKIL